MDKLIREARAFLKPDREVHGGVRYGLSRRLMTLECAISTSVSNLVSGAFIADLVAYCGGSGALTGIINAVPSLTTPVQLLSALAFGRAPSRKRAIVIINAVVRMLYVFLFLTPLAAGGSRLALPMIVACVVCYNILNNLAAPASTNWLVDLVPESRRSRYFANREGASLVVLAVCMLTAGGMIDAIQLRCGKEYGFLFIAMMTLMLGAADILVLMRVDEPEARRAEEAHGWARLKLLAEPLKQKSVRRVMVFSVLWSVSSMFGGPFSGTYQVVNLELRFSYIMALSVLSVGIRVVLTPLSGKIAARIGDLPVAIYSVALIAIHYVLWAFTVKENAHVMLPILFVESAIGFAGVNFSLFNVQMRSMPQDMRTAAISVTNTIAGVLGFLSTLLGSLMIGLIGGRTLTVGGFVLCDLQIVFFLTAAIMLLCAAYGLALMPKRKQKSAEIK